MALLVGGAGGCDDLTHIGCGSIEPFARFNLCCMISASCRLRSRIKSDDKLLAWAKNLSGTMHRMAGRADESGSRPAPHDD